MPARHERPIKAFEVIDHFKKTRKRLPNNYNELFDHAMIGFRARIQMQSNRLPTPNEEKAFRNILETFWKSKRIEQVLKDYEEKWDMPF